MDEATLNRMSRAKHRCAQAGHFLHRLRESSGPPRDDYFEMTCNIDACLFTLGSIWDFANRAEQGQLRTMDGIVLVSVLRHISAHHFSIASPIVKSGYDRPFNREMNNSVGDSEQSSSARLRVDFARLKHCLDQYVRDYPNGRNAAADAEVSRSRLEASARGKVVYFDDFLAEVIRKVEAAVA